MRRTLLQPKIRKHVGNAAPWLALVVALIWTVHPLQTESVTYVAQRAESLMGLFFLLTMYLSIRGFEVSRSFWWQTSAVASCVLGMAAKEVMATVPLMVLLYDVAFVTGSWRAAWNARWKFYVCLMLLGWGTLAALLLVAGGSNLGNVQALLGQLGGREGAARGGHEVHWLDYARMQCWAVARYVRLCFWPNPLIFYYGKDMAKNIWSVLPSALAVALLLASAVAAWRRRSWMGFAGAWFFLILAPTSSIVPLSGQTVAEHRMYLPLAAVVSLMVIGSYVLFQKLAPSCSNDSGHRRGMTLRGGGFVIVLLLLLTLGGLTIARNADYRTRFSIWHDTVKKWPTNPVAHNNLAEVLLQKGQLDEAKSHCETALDLNPDYPEAHNNLGVAHLRLGDPREAAVQFQKAIELKPKYAGAYSNLGSALLLQGKMAEAMDHFQKALQLNPAKADARINLGHALLHLGKKDEAIEHLQMALEAEPDHAEAHNNLGEALRETGKLDAAMEHLNTALKLRPNYADARINLGSIYYQTGREKEAVVQFDEAVKLNPKAISALNNLSWILAVSSNETLRNPARALELAQRANDWAATIPPSCKLWPPFTPPTAVSWRRTKPRKRLCSSQIPRGTARWWTSFALPAAITRRESHCRPRLPQRRGAPSAARSDP